MIEALILHISDKRVDDTIPVPFSERQISALKYGKRRLMVSSGIGFILTLIPFVIVFTII